MIAEDSKGSDMVTADSKGSDMVTADRGSETVTTNTHEPSFSDGGKVSLDAFNKALQR